MSYPCNNLFFRLSKKPIPTSFINRLSSTIAHALGCPKPIFVSMNSHSFRVFHPFILPPYPSAHTHFETSRKQDFLSSFSFSLLFSQSSSIICIKLHITIKASSSSFSTCKCIKPAALLLLYHPYLFSFLLKSNTISPFKLQFLFQIKHHNPQLH